jgi:hypothetical protein
VEGLDVSVVHYYVFTFENHERQLLLSPRYASRTSGLV